MGAFDIIGNNTLLIGFVLVVVFCIWKFWLQPQMNEGKPIEPSEEDLKPLEEKLGLTELMNDVNTEI
jgi:hypothetical protein